MLQDRRGLGLGLGIGISSFGGGIQPFIMSVKTNNAGTSSSTQFKLPLPSSGTYNFSVDWGDGTNNTITAYNQAQTTHTYSTAGTYTIKILGVCIGWAFGGGGDCLKLLDVSQYGCLTINTGSNFNGCANLVGTALDAPKIITTNINSMFYGCSKFNGNVGNWNTSGVTNTNAMFLGCTVFNNGGSPSINNWAFAPTNIDDMFFSCSAFNQPVGNWNMSNCTSFYEAFYGCIIFNQNIGTWNVAKATTFYLTFAYCSAFNNGGSSSIGNWTFDGLSNVMVSNMFVGCSSFNQPVNWNIKVSSASSAFTSCTIFNQNLGNWDMSNCTNAGNMFSYSPAFNNGGSPDINNWNMANVTVIGGIFLGCTAFNQPVGSWNTSNITNMADVFFGCSTFNQNIGAWNVSKVTSFLEMFYGCTAFNNGGSSTINNWTINTTSAVTMYLMFYACTSFTQPINSWNVSKVNNLVAFMDGKSSANYSTANYDAILNSWSLLTLTPNVGLGMGSIKRTAAGTAGRAILTSAPNNWTVTDGGI